MPRLTPQQEAAFPTIVAEEKGNASAIGRRLGISRFAAWKRLNGGRAKAKPKPQPSAEVVRAVEERAADDEGDGTDERRKAKEITLKATETALKDEDAELLLKAADRLIAIANGKVNARRAAIIYLDQRDQRTQVNAQVIMPATKRILFIEWWERVIGAEVEDGPLLARLRRRAETLEA